MGLSPSKIAHTAPPMVSGVTETCGPGLRRGQQTVAQRATLSKRVLNPGPFFPNPEAFLAWKNIRHKPNQQEAPF